MRAGRRCCDSGWLDDNINSRVFWIDYGIIGVIGADMYVRN